MNAPQPKPLSTHRGRALLGALVACSLALAACDGKPKLTSPVLAKVNKDEVFQHQHEFVMLQQRNVPPAQQDAVARQQLERLVDQQLALQKADSLKLERDPRVLLQLEMARRDVLARAYIDKVSEAAAKPTADEVRKYYEDKPALFAQRRIFNLQELAIDVPAAQVEELRARLAASKNVNEFVEHLRANNIRFGANQAVRGAEQLPAQALEAVSRMQDGQAIFSTGPGGVQVLVLAGSRLQPVTLEQAQPAIEQQLLNERRNQLVADDLKALRAAAKIEYQGKFAGAAVSAPGK
jgi:EpsD family peptidyl-prolyl cis-trans isomerase